MRVQCRGGYADSFSFSASSLAMVSMASVHVLIRTTDTPRRRQQMRVDAKIP